jgi:hypothetical protein
MPYVRKGKTVYKKHPDGHLTKKGTSTSVEGAKRYMKKLYMVESKPSSKKRR